MNEIILVGNPNVGKTTLFNNLTHSNEKVSNWHGVTVGVKSKKYNYKNQEYIVSDLPGLYSLQGYSNEEKIAKEYLLKNKDKIVFNICDANNLRRNLKLTTELVNLNLKVVVLVNMCTECKLFDYQKLSQELGVMILEIDARKKDSIEDIKELILHLFDKQKTQKIYKINKKPVIYNDLIKDNAKNIQIDSYKYSNKIDKFILNKITFPIIFFTLIFAIFYLTFGPVGGWISSSFELILNQIKTFLQKIINYTNITPIIKTFIFEAVFDGLFGIISFLPQIVLLMFFLNLLEDIGFMSRVAFMFDGMLQKVGLTGKSLFSLSLGFGCTTSAVIATRNLENKSLRKRTVLLLPFVSCSAKLPVFLVLVSLFFDNYKYLFVFLIYMFSILLLLGCALLYKKFIPSQKNVFILEMPKYRLPNLSKILKNIWGVVKEFLVKVATIMLLFNVVFWVLQNFTFSFVFLNGQNFERSMLYQIALCLSSVFGVIGLGNVGVIVALIFGMVAKEMVVVGLAMMNGVSGSLNLLCESLVLESSLCHFDIVSSLVFLVFVLLYSPCISALLTIKNELGIKSAVYVFMFQFVFAFVISFVVYKILMFPWLLIWLAVFIVLDIFVYVVLKLKKKKGCRGNCCACRKI